MKKCIKCYKTKFIDQFYKRVKSPDGHNNKCIMCVRKESSENAKKNPERRKTTYKIWRTKNKDRYNEYSRNRYHANPESKKRYTKKNRQRINKYQRDKRKKDPQYKIGSNLRRRLNKLLKKEIKPGSPIRHLGCTLEFLVSYIESRFEPGMTWQNYSLFGWHIDHIRQLASFDLTDPEQFSQACHYTNLQPMWAKPNTSKNKPRSFFKL